MIGVLMLNTRFPRLFGDIGNPDTFDGAVIYECVQTAPVDAVVRKNGLSGQLIEDFCQAAKRLQQNGATVITTSCGFLAPVQSQISASVSVPVVCSSLSLAPWLLNVFGSGGIGVITFDADQLGDIHFAAQTMQKVKVIGLPKEGELHTTITEDRVTLSQPQAQAEVLRTCDKLLEREAGIKALLLECTNISPYKDEIRQHTGLPVFDLVDMIKWMDQAFR